MSGLRRIAMWAVWNVPLGRMGALGDGLRHELASSEDCVTKKHSKLGASASDRWMNCPGSIRMSAGIPSIESDYAKEGTVAHEVCERLLAEAIAKSKITLPSEIKGVAVDDEMREHAASYVEYVLSRFADGDELTVEERFSLPQLHPDFFGTADCVIYKPDEKRLIVIDFKYGRGIPVEAKGNPQLRYYALGAAMKKHNRGVSVIETVIVQPRCPHPDGPIRSDEISALELMDWSGDLVAAANATQKPDAPLNPGDWCKFCPAAATCPAMREKALAAAQADFADDGTLHLSDPLSYAPKQVWDMLPQIDLIEDWCRNVRAFAHHEAEAGRCDPRFKLVATRPTRKWKDDEAASVSLLVDHGLDRGEIFVEKMRSPAQIEKVIGAKRKKEIAALIESVSSGTVLAPANDPRPPVRPEATTEFSAVE